jgi:serine/threonine-protein kinase RsbT
MSYPEVPAAAESKSINPSIEVSIGADTDIVAARQHGRRLAGALGFSSSDATIVATAISELARNIVLYAKRGEIILRAVRRADRSAVIITARDQGMGIADLSRAMQDGYSTSGRLGVGLPGVKRLMDEFDIVSEVGKGTVITVTKWQRGGSAARTSHSPWLFETPWGTESASLDGRGSDQRERGSVEGTFARSQEARNLSPSSPRGPGSFDAGR